MHRKMNRKVGISITSLVLSSHKFTRSQLKGPLDKPFMCLTRSVSRVAFSAQCFLQKALENTLLWEECIRTKLDLVIFLEMMV